MEQWRDELYHHGIKGMKWGERRFQYKDGSLTPAGKHRYNNASGENRKKNVNQKAKSALNIVKRAANDALDKAERDNFFNSDSMFSESSMKRSAQIKAARNIVDSLDYDKLKDPKKRKQLLNDGKSIVNDYLDDMDNMSFFNDDWDTRKNKRDKRDKIRNLINS